MNEAMTVQFARIVEVVNVVPVNTPPQVPETMAECPAFGVTVNVNVIPPATICVPVGDSTPLEPAVAFTVNACVVTLKLRDTATATAKPSPPA